jgi:hypothetical protein
MNRTLTAKRTTSPGRARRAWAGLRSLASCPCWECSAGRHRILWRLAWLVVAGAIAAGHARIVLSSAERVRVLLLAGANAAPR